MNHHLFVESALELLMYCVLVVARVTSTRMKLLATTRMSRPPNGDDESNFCMILRPAVIVVGFTHVYHVHAVSVSMDAAAVTTTRSEVAPPKVRLT
jgi:hypothetical protein